LFGFEKLKVESWKLNFKYRKHVFVRNAVKCFAEIQKSLQASFCSRSISAGHKQCKCLCNWKLHSDPQDYYYVHNRKLIRQDLSRTVPLQEWMLVFRFSNAWQSGTVVSGDPSFLKMRLHIWLSQVECNICSTWYNSFLTWKYWHSFNGIYIILLYIGTY